MIEVKASGDFNNTEAFLKSMKDGQIFDILSRYGEIGRQALADATPVHSGLMANSWSYEVVSKPGRHEIIWKNSAHLEGGAPVAILLQYGHATGTGGWVEGVDYINPAIQPLFDQIANEVWEKVKHA